MKTQKQQRGFTLVEVLIVVIIIAVLASLILPRFLSQPEKAVVAEANQMLGVMGRAQHNYGDSINATTGTWVAVDADTDTDWNMIGLKKPAKTNFTYACTTSACTATRSGSDDHAGNVITLSSNNEWSTTTASGKTAYTCTTTGGCKA